MNLDTILNSLLSAAAALKEPLQDATSHSLKEAYHTAKSYLLRKLGEDSADALRQAIEQPTDAARQTELLASAKCAKCENDAELHRLIGELDSVVAKARTSTKYGPFAPASLPPSALLWTAPTSPPATRAFP